MRVDVPVTLASVVAVVVGMEGTPTPPREQPDGQEYDDDPNGNFGSLLNGLGQIAVKEDQRQAEQHESSAVSEPPTKAHEARLFKAAPVL